MLLARAESSPVDGLPLERRSLILIAPALACRSALGGEKQATRTVPPHTRRWFDICEIDARPRNARGRRISKAVEEGPEEADEVVSRESRQSRQGRQGTNAW